MVEIFAVATAVIQQFSQLNWKCGLNVIISFENHLSVVVVIVYFLRYVQWLYLLKVFDDYDMCQRLGKQAESFRDVHSKFTVGFNMLIHTHTRTVV